MSVWAPRPNGRPTLLPGRATGRGSGRNRLVGDAPPLPDLTQPASPFLNPLDPNFNNPQTPPNWTYPPDQGMNPLNYGNAVPLPNVIPGTPAAGLDPTSPAFNNPQPLPPVDLGAPPSTFLDPTAPGFANPQPLPGVDLGAPSFNQPVSPRLIPGRTRRGTVAPGVPIPAPPAATGQPAPVNPFTNIFKQRFR